MFFFHVVLEITKKLHFGSFKKKVKKFYEYLYQDGT